MSDLRQLYEDRWAKYGSADIDAVVQKAIAAERERCAKIAERAHELIGREDEPVFRAKTIGEIIARSIRKD